MRLKIIQINIWKASLLDDLVTFLNKERPDVITMQEVASGSESLHSDPSLDVFLRLKESLGMQGVLAPRLFADAKSYWGNAVFTRHSIVSQNIFWLRRSEGFLPKTEEFQTKRVHCCNVLDATVRIESQDIHVLSVHGAWTKEPIDTPEKIRQAKLLARYIKDLGDAPFLLGGDFNMPRDTKVISLIEAQAKNALVGSTVTRTTHPTIHKTAKAIPEGLLIDFIFTSPHFSVLHIDAPEVAISDHLPVRAELMFNEDSRA